tara:strand:- start:465 stop:1007 length:543 start_codon:yes stop_codon:yes gene_type:complete
MQLEDLIKTPQLSVKLHESFFNIVNFTPVIEYIHNLSIDKISEFDDELKFNNKQHKKYIFHYFIYYTCEILKVHNKKNKPVIYFDIVNELNKNYISFLDLFTKKFPVIVLREPMSFKDFNKKLKCNGISEELNILLMRRLNKVQTNRFYFSRLQYFCKHYELTFLDKTYFNDIRNKLSLL